MGTGEPQELSIDDRVSKRAGRQIHPTDIDIDALREKYKHEREKRLRSEGSKQYVEMKDEFEEYYDVDPHTPVTEGADRRGHRRRRARRRFAGLLSAAQLKQAGVEDVRIIEKGGDFGGVWYWNRYPGIQCDNESYCYIPLLEELDFIPSKKFADGAEIFEHCRRHRQALRPVRRRDLLHAGARAALGRGHQALADQHRPRRRHPRALRRDGPGSYNRPKLPGIPGIKDFTGHSSTPRVGTTSTPEGIPTAVWTSSRTSGSRSSAPVPLVFSSFRSSASDAKHLYVFQRTPSSVDARNNTADRSGVGRLAAARLAEGAAAQLPRLVPFVGDRAGRTRLVCDFWTELGRNDRGQGAALDDPASLDPEQFMAIREEENYKLMERLRRHVESMVDDPDTAEALKPYYRFLCKRPCSSDDYLPRSTARTSPWWTCPSPKVWNARPKRGSSQTVSSTRSIASSIASGFEITTEISRRYSIEAIEGRDGRRCSTRGGQGFKTFHGMTSRGFPNQFYTGFTQVGISANICANYELQGEHIAYIISEALVRGVTTGRAEPRGSGRLVPTVKETFDRQLRIRRRMHARLLQQRRRRGWRRQQVTPR